MGYYSIRSIICLFCLYLGSNPDLLRCIVPCTSVTRIDKILQFWRGKNSVDVNGKIGHTAKHTKSNCVILVKNKNNIYVSRSITLTLMISPNSNCIVTSVTRCLN